MDRELEVLGVLVILATWVLHVDLRPLGEPRLRPSSQLRR